MANPCSKFKLLLSLATDRSELDEQTLQHLNHCAACQQFFQQTTKLLALAKATDQVKNLHPDWTKFQQGLTAKLDHAGGSRSWIPRLALAAAALLILVLGGYRLTVVTDKTPGYLTAELNTDKILALSDRIASLADDYAFSTSSSELEAPTELLLLEDDELNLLDKVSEIAYSELDLENQVEELSTQERIDLINSLWQKV